MMTTTPGGATSTRQSPQRVNVSLTGEAADVVRELAARHGVSPAEVVRRALAVQRFIDEETDSGSAFLVRKSNGDTDRIQFVFT